jgi:hypothetical protein
MLLCGVKELAALRSVPRVYTGELREWLDTFGIHPEGVPA